MEETFRAAGHADIETLVPMMRGLYEHDQGFFDEPRARRALAALLDQPGWGRVFVVQADGRPVGYLVLTFGYSLEYRGRDALVDELYLEPSARGQGLGTAALRFAEEVCRAEGIGALHLEVERANTRAQAVYRQFGFHHHDRFLMTKWVDEATEDRTEDGGVSREFTNGYE